MAGRQLRRLQQQAAQPELLNQSEEDEADSPPAAAKPSLFDLLGEDGAGDEPSENSDGSDEEPPTTASLPASDAPPKQGPAAIKAGPKQRKKRKPKKGASKAAQDTKDGDEEDLDKLLERLNIPLSPSEPSQSEPSAAASTSSALTIDVRKLKPEDELRRMFGSKVVNEQARESTAGAEFAGASRRVRRLLARGVLQREALKPGLLITPRDHWPRPDSGLGMERRRDAEELEFVYTFSPGYQAAQAEFERVQASFDPNQLLGFLSYHPYHTDALLAASDLYRASRQDETADDLLARCVYGLEMAWAPQFNPTNGKCRLSSEAEENLGFLRALSRYVQSLTRRGLHASAFEVAKLLLSCERSDACGSLLAIDYLAIKARQYDFPQALVAELDPAGQDFSGFPNWTYSLALAAFLNDTNNNRVSAASEETLSRGARAVMLMPNVVVTLTARLKEQGTRLSPAFQKLLEQPLFSEAAQEPSASLAHLTAIYVERQHSLYKDPVVLGWIQKCCEAAAAPGNEGQRLSWRAAKQQLWPASKENEFAALRISQFSDDIAALPEEELQAMAAQRELAPEEELARLLQQQQGNLELQEAAELGPDEGVASALLRTLLPWVNVGRDPGAEASRERDEDAETQHDDGPERRQPG